MTRKAALNKVSDDHEAMLLLCDCFTEKAFFFVDWVGGCSIMNDSFLVAVLA